MPFDKDKAKDADAALAPELLPMNPKAKPESDAGPDKKKVPPGVFLVGGTVVDFNGDPADRSEVLFEGKKLKDLGLTPADFD